MVSGAPARASIDGMTEITIDIAPPRGASRLPRLSRAGRDLAYLLIGLPVSIVTSTVAITGLSLAAGLAVTLIGIPVLLGTLYACRWMAGLERRRAAWVLGEPITGRERPWTGGLWTRTQAAATDQVGWLDTVWAVLLAPVASIGFSVAVSLWATALGLLTSPLWLWAIPEEDDSLALFNDPAAGYAALRVLVGLALIPVAFAACRALAEGTARLAKAILG
jgi:hypothetical protein